mmetsp:Transcript_41090/g.68282  ORF Transcript_41090/g.68282 Transcript_41090/m.68282 type:complete len:205 (+) Transcript_41090:232-846(+)
MALVCRFSGRRFPKRCGLASLLALPLLLPLGFPFLPLLPLPLSILHRVDERLLTLAILFLLKEAWRPYTSWLPSLGLRRQRCRRDRQLVEWVKACVGKQWNRCGQRPALHLAGELKLGVISHLFVSAIAMFVHAEQEQRIVSRGPTHLRVTSHSSMNSRSLVSPQRVRLSFDGVRQTLQCKQSSHQRRSELMHSLGVFSASRRN